MFDWNDEELTDIWGEANENSDHIVPYPKGDEEKPLGTIGTHSKKQWSKEDSPVKLEEEQKKQGVSDDTSGFKPESSSQINADGLSALEMDTWPDSPLPSAACSKEYVARNDTARLDNDPQFFGDENEEKDHGDFLDYSWANIGTFDDLDRIFRNDDPIFGRESLGNADELWSSSADVISSPAKFPISAGSPSLGFDELRNTSEQYEIKMESMQNEDQPTGCGRMSDSNTHFLKNVEPSTDIAAGTGSCTFLNPAVECAAGKNTPLVEEEKTDNKMTGKIPSDPLSISENSAAQNIFANKVNGKGVLKCPKKEEESEGKSRDLCGAWSPGINQFQQFGNQLLTSSMQTFPSSVLTPQRQPGGLQTLTYMQTSHPCLTTGYGNPTNHYPVAPMLPHVSERDKDQSALAGYRYPQVSSKHVKPLKKFPDVLSRSVTMTPQEKIEKLRRRQQMQAMLAIQEQQQQFGHQVTGTDYSDTQRCPQENQSQDTERSNIEVQENLKFSASLESSSPMEQKDSNTIFMLVDDCSVEERVLNQLQDVIGKLDMSIRLCIRDSLFRLAQSATHRHNSNDTSSTNNFTDEHDGIVKEETDGQNRSSRIPDAEKETNPIDRTVAHLLFRKPLESSATKPLKDGQLPESTDSMSTPKTEGFMNLPVGYLSDDSTGIQRLPNPPWMVAEPYHTNQFQNNTYISTPENTSNDEPEDGTVMGVVEASQ